MIKQASLVRLRMKLNVLEVGNMNKNFGRTDLQVNWLKTTGYKIHWNDTTESFQVY
jgi:hypothetical protein